MNIYIIRHGETVWNKIHKLQGRSDIALNEYGIELARITSAALSGIRFDKAYSSPLSRAVDTAHIILGDRDISVDIDDRLLEIDFGDAEGTILEDVDSYRDTPLYNCLKHPDLYTTPINNGESFDHIIDRAGEFLTQVIAPLEGQYSDVLLTTHGGWIRAALSYICDVPRVHFWDCSVQKNCAVNIIDCTAGKFTPVELSKLYYTIENPSSGIL